MGLPENEDPMAVAIDYCHTVNENISFFLRDKNQKMEFNLESYKKDFLEFWKRIGAKGDFEAAISEFSVKHNASW